MDDQTQLLRQVHPSFVQDGKITSQVFRPTPKDDKKLSSYDGDLITPDASYAHFTAREDCRSAGVVSITAGECLALGLPTVADPEEFPEHVLIDFSDYEKKEVEKKAKILRANAESRDWLYKP
ncbi:hypothetical protein AO387_05575 [Pseudomonas syringae ICMP 11168]|uniref:hypothetical protein n=1 Tax=Pseudomonas syringae group TaxID=136849 RepID=UPI00072FCD95|nr:MULTISPECIES: hypothetical protein [Pseudomonas syringae group]KTC08488.1 hypothetical protein AO387_05575 [Pseudomonas syringae ICMP 11168]